MCSLPGGSASCQVLFFRTSLVFRSHNTRENFFWDFRARGWSAGVYPLLSLVPRCCFGLTNSASLSPVILNLSVVLCALMPVATEANIAPNTSSADIFSMCHGLQVIRISASTSLAQMVEFQPLRNLT